LNGAARYRRSATINGVTSATIIGVISATVDGVTSATNIVVTLATILTFRNIFKKGFFAGLFTESAVVYQG